MTIVHNIMSQMESMLIIIIIMLKEHFFNQTTCGVLDEA